MAKVFRKVYVSMWGDKTFNELSPIPPCGQGLWIWLLTSPLTGPIPGLFTAGPRAMAEALHWSDEAFREAFQEVLRKGMAEASPEDRLVWLPNAIEYNRPESPNVILSWAAYYDTLPECALRDKAINHLREVIYTMGEAFREAFDKAFGKPSVKAIGKAMPNQEQEQENKQYQEQDNMGGESAPAPEARPPTPPDGTTSKTGDLKTYGPKGLVRLSPSAYAELVADWGASDVDRLILVLEEQLVKGKRYPDHAAKISSWLLEDEAKGKARRVVHYPTFTPDPPISEEERSRGLKVFERYKQSRPELFPPKVTTNV